MRYEVFRHMFRFNSQNSLLNFNDIGSIISLEGMRERSASEYLHISQL